MRSNWPLSFHTTLSSLTMVGAPYFAIIWRAARRGRSGQPAVIFSKSAVLTAFDVAPIALLEDVPAGGVVDVVGVARVPGVVEVVGVVGVRVPLEEEAGGVDDGGVAVCGGAA